MPLFHLDNAQYFDLGELRTFVRTQMSYATLIQRAAAGERAAAGALHVGFWPFVREFECAIDQHHLARRPLQQRFGRARTGQTFGHIARTIREMRHEEGSHAAHWRKDASSLGIEVLDGPVVDGVQALIDSAYVDDHTLFFAMLAGTELVAEEMSLVLVGAPAFLSLFGRGRWVWGEIHLAPHDHGPSHLEVDLDLARAYGPPGPAGRAQVDEAVRAAVLRFGVAAHRVEQQLLELTN